MIYNNWACHNCPILFINIKMPQYNQQNLFVTKTSPRLNLAMSSNKHQQAGITTAIPPIAVDF